MIDTIIPNHTTGESERVRIHSCPFCGGHNLFMSQVWTETRDYTAVSCSDCLSEAPSEIWNLRNNWSENHA